MTFLFEYRNLRKLLSILCMGFFLFACAPKAKIATELDTPEHHTSAGIKFLSEGKYGDAQREFGLALHLNPKFSKAYGGLGLVKANKGDAKGAFEAVKEAEKYAGFADEKLAVHVCCIRIYTMLKPDNNWLKNAEAEFKNAMGIDAKAASAHYFMGLAYKDMLDFAKAEQMFKTVINLKQDYVGDADRERQLAQKIQRAMPTTVTGKKIAVLEKITRADAAALLIEELGIDELYKNRIPKTFDTTFKTPEGAKTVPASGDYTATDIIRHPLRADIEGILRLGVWGLGNYRDGSFHPDDYINRATYAMVIEDILIKATGDEALAVKYMDNPSPFPDLRPDLPYFNAAMTVTTRGFMEAMATGEFGATAPVSGVDALLIIRKIREYLKIS